MSKSVKVKPFYLASLIQELEAIHDEFGDVPVFFLRKYTTVGIEAIITGHKEEGVTVLLVDAPALEELRKTGKMRE